MIVFAEGVAVIVFAEGVAVIVFKEQLMIYTLGALGRLADIPPRDVFDYLLESGVRFDAFMLDAEIFAGQTHLLSYMREFDIGFEEISVRLTQGQYDRFMEEYL